MHIHTRRRRRAAFVAAALAGAVPRLAAQTPQSTEERLKQLEQAFEKYREQSERENAELRTRLREVQQSMTASAPASNPALDNAVAELQARLNSLGRRQDASEAARGQRTAYLDLSFDILGTAGASQATDKELDVVQGGGHDPNQRGITVPNAELALEGAIDPYLRGNANIVFQVDKLGGTNVELEEAYLTTVALPADLQFKFGQYFTEFGRINRQHPHQWDFVDEPLVNLRMFGGDGLRGPGGRLSWLAPTPFYFELQSGIQNARGETQTSFLGTPDTWPSIVASAGTPIPGAGGGRPFAKDDVKNFGDLLFTERASASFELGDTSTLVAGASAVFGPNSTGDGGRTAIYGGDLLYKWKPTNNDAGWPFVTLQTEAMWRDFRAARFAGDADGDSIAEFFPSHTYRDFGAYAQAVYGFARPWAAALRGDYVDGDGLSTGGDGMLDRRFRVSPNVTYYPSEFSKIRLQFNWDRVQELGDRSFYGLWLQFEILFGAHGAHKF